MRQKYKKISVSVEREMEIEGREKRNGRLSASYSDFKLKTYFFFVFDRTVIS